MNYLCGTCLSETLTPRCPLCAPCNAAGDSAPSPALSRARRFVREFLEPVGKDGVFEYGDGKPMCADVRSLLRMMRLKMPELF